MRLLFLFLCITSAFSLAAQNGELSAILDEIISNVQTVESKGKTIEQSLSYEPDAPYRVKLNTTTISKKGKASVEEFTFSLADINPKLISYRTKSKMLTLTIKTANQLKSVKYFKESEHKGYKNEVAILANDVDNARLMEDLFEKTIPLAQELDDQRLQVSTFDEKLAWLIENVTEVSNGKTTYEQSIIELNPKTRKIELKSLKNTGRKVTDQKFVFSLGDLNEHAVQLKIVSKEVKLEIETKRRQKFIEEFADGVRNGYSNRLTLMVSTIEQGRDMAKILREMIPPAEEQLKKEITSVPASFEPLGLMEEEIQEVAAGKVTYRQTIQPNCLCELTIEKEASNNKVTASTYSFNFADLIETPSSSVSAKLLAVEIVAKGKKKLIREMENGQIKSYKSNLDIPANGVDNGRKLAFLIGEAVKACSAKAQDRIPDDPAKAKLLAIDLINDQDLVSDQYEQTLASNADDDCKMEFTKTKILKNKSVEELFEFNLQDIDPNLIDFKISAKELSVEVTTRYKEKIIKVYKNGEVGNFVNSFTIYSEDIEVARNIIAALKKAIEGCNS